jgi:cytochrome c-type biogenesis protein CcmE
MLRSLILALVSAAMLVAAYPALAQKTGPNGGLLAGKEGHETELVVSATELAVFILDHGKPHETKGVKMKAVIQHDGKTVNVDLVAADAKKMVGKLPAPLGKGAIVVLTGKDDHGDVISARYVLK